MSKQLETISTLDLATVNGGDNKQAPHYNGEDLRNGVQGAAQGAVRGGPLGAVWGFGAGFMKRNVGELIDAGRDLYREYNRGKQLDKQLKQRQGG